MSLRPHALAAASILALAGQAHAQLVSSWAAPAFDDGNPSSDPVNSWLTDTTTGEISDLPNVFGLRNLAADNARGRLYSAGGDFLITYVVDPDSNTDGVAELTPRVLIRDQQGEPIGRSSALGFARGRLYAFAPAGFFTIDPDTGLATPLPSPIPGQGFRGIDYNPDDALMYAVRGSFPNEEIVAFDLDTFTLTPVAFVPEDVYNFAALGSYNFDGVAVGEGKVFLTTNLSDQFGSLRTAVYDIASGEFSTLPNPPRRGENRSYPGGATYFTGFPEPASPERSVQVRSVDFETGVIELFNFGSGDLDLSGWRFCSHDFDDVRRYTGAAGFDGVTIEAGTSVFVHINNDAPAGDDSLNRADLGGAFALPLDQDAYGLQIFFPDNGSVSFGNSALIADHLQWNTDGAGVGSAEFRTGQAVSEGLWSATGDFIATAPDSSRIDLVDLSGDEAGAPGEYAVESGDFYDEDRDGDLSDDPAAPTALDLQPGSNVVTGTVERSNDLEAGDRDFITFSVPEGLLLDGLELLAWDPDNIGFIAVNEGATGFIPGFDTNDLFLSGILVATGDVGSNLMEDFVSNAVTTNSLSEPVLRAGTYTVVVQQTSDLVQAYSLGFTLSEDPACSPADQAEPFGVLDFNDVIAFLGAFTAGLPQADLAAPFGFFDFNDVIAYLTLFGDGCP